MKNKNNNDKWKEVLTNIQKSVTEISFNTWIRPLILKSVDEENNLIIFEVFNPLLVKVVNERYNTILEDRIKEVFGKPLKPVFQIPDANESISTRQSEYTEELLFNPKYTFDNFIVGDNNKYANAAAVAVAQSPSAVYNPLYIYGDSGLGKTHLMNAIGIYMMNEHPELKILYVSAETFVNDLIDSIRNNKTDEFKNKYRQLDVLLIDDVQFIEGKGRSEEEFFHTFSALYENNKQIILSSDRAPSKMTKIDSRLKSRFEWNLVADIQPPDRETRIAILQAKAQLEGIEIDKEINEVIFFISDKIKNNIRELEGALNRVISFSRILDEKIDIKFAKHILKDLDKKNNNDITPERIIDCVCKQYNIKRIDIQSNSRKKTVAYPRQIAMYLCREMTGISFPKLGEYFGGRDHSTIMHGYDKIYYDINNDDELKITIKQLMDEIQEN